MAAVCWIITAKAVSGSDMVTRGAGETAGEMAGICMEEKMNGRK